MVFRYVFCFVAIIVISTVSCLAGDFKPANAVPFEYEEITVDIGICQRVEFSKKKMNITLKNKSDVERSVNLKISVLNADGVVIFEAREIWIINKLEPDAKYAKDFDFKTGMPVALQYSRYAENFDMTPKWIIVEEE